MRIEKEVELRLFAMPDFAFLDMNQSLALSVDDLRTRVSA
jgi:hypothetical protein